jgi:hypothetical protein
MSDGDMSSCLVPELVKVDGSLALVRAVEESDSALWRSAKVSL